MLYLRVKLLKIIWVQSLRDIKPRVQFCNIRWFAGFGIWVWIWIEWPLLGFWGFEVTCDLWPLIGLCDFLLSEIVVGIWVSFNLHLIFAIIAENHNISECLAVVDAQTRAIIIGITMLSSYQKLEWNYITVYLLATQMSSPNAL